MLVQASVFAQPMRDGRINLAHLNYLCEVVELDDEPVMLTHIYADAPTYKWTDAAGEGIAALDDVARAGIVYLDFYERTQDRRALHYARAALNFTLRMQADDGEFYNFVVDKQGTINRDGMTSRKSLGWWAYRGMWLLARGVKTFQRIDKRFAARLQAAYLKTETLIAARLPSPQQVNAREGVSLPQWLPDDAADACGVLIIALAEYQQIHPNALTAKLLTAYADALAVFQLSAAPLYGFSMHPHTTREFQRWHAWGAHQAQALALAGRVLKRSDYIESARREVEHLFAWQLAATRVHELLPLPRVSGQQVYGINCIVQAAMNLYHATLDKRYAKLAGLFAAWLNGDNPVRAVMYDERTGRGFDGIDIKRGAAHVNRNAGAESTIEALMVLHTIQQHPLARRYSDYQPATSMTWRISEAENICRGAIVSNEKYSNTKACMVAADTELEIVLNVPTTRRYLIYLAHGTGDDEALPPTSTAIKHQLEIKIDGQKLVPEVSARRRLWLDLINLKPMRLTKGRHRLKVRASHTTTIDGVLLNPATITKTYRQKYAKPVHLRFETIRGKLVITEGGKPL